MYKLSVFAVVWCPYNQLHVTTENMKKMEECALQIVLTWQ